MSLQNLYHLADDEIDHLYETLTICFLEDDLYKTMFPKSHRRFFFLEHFFKYYIQMLKTSCVFVGDSKECNAVMVVFDSALEKKSQIFRLIRLNAKMMVVLLRMHSLQEIHRLIDCWDMFTSRWVNAFVSGDYLHMDLLCTKANMRGKGIGSKLIEELIEEGKERNCDITMETHHNENLSLYEAKGFTLMSTITRENYDLIQYNLRMSREDIK